MPLSGLLGHGFKIHYVDQRKPQSHDGQLMDGPGHALHAGGLHILHGIVTEQGHVTPLEPRHHRGVIAGRVGGHIPGTQLGAPHPAAGA
jgi:hypothetical protein